VVPTPAIVHQESLAEAEPLVEKDWRDDLPPPVMNEGPEDLESVAQSDQQIADGPVERDWRYEPPVEIEPTSERAYDVAPQPGIIRQLFRLIKFVVVLTICNIVPAVAFGYGTIRFWEANRAAAIVCISGFAVAALLGTFYAFKQLRSRA
jgi:hypothetical protein